jgi:hypothetical protein
MTLNQLRKELKQIGFQVKTETLSWGKHASIIHIESGLRVSSGGVYSKEQAESFQVFHEFKEKHLQDFKNIKESEGIIGLV